jgi:hypothetical protein
MKRQMEARLEAAVRGLPHEKILQVIDFAGYLRSKYASDAPQRGSSEAILEALEQIGPLQFAPEELDTLLAEIQTMREMDMETDDELSARCSNRGRGAGQQFGPPNR